MPQRYLVTGCAGFIGARVSECLLDDGHSVIGLDNLSATYDRRLKDYRLLTLTSHDLFAFHEVDIGNRPALERVFGESNSVAESQAAEFQAAPPISAVFNLAARAGVRPSVENPWPYFDANLVGTLNLLECCRRFAVPKFVLSSTSSLYGDANPTPFREDADTSRPLSPYAASKKAAETLAYSYHHLHNIDVSIVRYFTVYGPAGRPDMSVFRFVRQMAEGEPIVVFGDGSRQRDFTYVDDVARGTIAAARPLGYEIVNLGGDRPVALREVIDRIAALLGATPSIEYRPAHPADVQTTWADIGKARRLLGWSPEVSLDEGLKRCVQWYRENRDFAVQLGLKDG
jgi:nucleoside-diphosphate-sugar epimerase